MPTAAVGSPALVASGRPGASPLGRPAAASPSPRPSAAVAATAAARATAPAGTATAVGSAAPGRTPPPTRAPAARVTPSPATPGQRSAPPASAASTIGPAPTPATSDRTDGPTTDLPLPITGLGATTLLAVDGFDDAGAWRTGASPDGEVGVEEGALRLVAAGDATVVGSSRPIGADVPVVRIVADVAFAGGAGAVGLLCASGEGDDRTIHGWASTDGRWRLVRSAGGAERELAAGPLPTGVSLTGGGIVRLALECADTGGADGERAAFWVDGTLVADRLTGVRAGPWGRVGIEVAADEPPLLAFADEARTWTGARYEAVAMDPAVALLLTHVPDTWRATCIGAGDDDRMGATAAVACSPAGSADRAVYRTYPDPAALDRAFDALLMVAGDVPRAGDCLSGPGQGTWSSGDGGEGRIACWSDRDGPGVRTIAWTDPATAILALGTRTSGSWADLYDWYLGAGPDR